jgi:hypothetical protein
VQLPDRREGNERFNKAEASANELFVQGGLNKSFGELRDRLRIQDLSRRPGLFGAEHLAAIAFVL